jgi:uncharacterized protein (DUF2147 family)
MAITTNKSVSVMRKYRRRVSLALIASATVSIGAVPLEAQPLAPNGTWLNEDKDAIVEIGDCGTHAGAPAASHTLCGKVVWLKNPVDPKTGHPLTDDKNVDPAQRGRPIMGMQPISAMKPSSTPGRWDGRVYDLDSGKAYDGSLIVRSATQMRVQGCLLLICQGEEWVRQAVPESPTAHSSPLHPPPGTRPATGSQPRAR